MGVKDLFFVSCLALLIGTLFIGWIALLNFPWDYSVRAAFILEAVLISFLLLSENSAASINGASGWVFFGFILGHVILFLSAGFFRLLVLLWGLF